MANPSGFRDIHINRRDFLGALALGGASLALPIRSWAWTTPPGLASAIANSQLVYISPLRSNGSESRCHGEVWFAPDGDDLLVVTNPERWRAAAIAKGLDRARLWVGEYGLWKKAEGRWEQAPSCTAKARLESDPEVHARALQIFGGKYSAEWGKWGPRFEKGLASGERVLIRYTPSAS